MAPVAVAGPPFYRHCMRGEPLPDERWSASFSWYTPSASASRYSIERQKTFIELVKRRYRTHQLHYLLMYAFLSHLFNAIWQIVIFHITYFAVHTPRPCFLRFLLLHAGIYWKMPLRHCRIFKMHAGMIDDKTYIYWRRYIIDATEHDMGLKFCTPRVTNSLRSAANCLSFSASPSIATFCFSKSCLERMFLWYFILAMHHTNKREHTKCNVATWLTILIRWRALLLCQTKCRRRWYLSSGLRRASCILASGNTVFAHGDRLQCEPSITGD